MVPGERETLHTAGQLYVPIRDSNARIALDTNDITSTHRLGGLTVDSTELQLQAAAISNRILILIGSSELNDAARGKRFGENPVGGGRTASFGVGERGP